MIEPIIIKRLSADPKIAEYVGKRIFIGSAPDGTHCPYMVVEAPDSPAEGDVVDTFDVTITIYDYDVTKTNIRNASARIKDALNYEVLEDPLGVYSRIRLWLESRFMAGGDDPNLSIMTLKFYGRATEFIRAGW